MKTFFPHSAPEGGLRPPASRHHRWVVSLLGGLILPFISSAADLSADFSVANNNPNGAWTYGFKTRGHPPTNVTVFSRAYSGYLGSVNGWDGYNQYAEFLPVVAKNVSNNSVNDGATFWLPQEASLIPGVQRDAVARWTAPASRTYTVSTIFRGISGSAPTADVSIYRGANALYTGQMDGYQTVLTVPVMVLSLTAGEIITFAVDSRGDNTNDSIGVSAVIDSGVMAMPPGLIGWWRGESNALDALGLNHGVASNGVTYATNGAGKVGQAFVFDGVNDYVLIPDSAALRPASITLEAWVMFDANSGCIVCRGLGTGDANSYALYVVPNALNGFIHDSGGGGVLTTIPFTPTVGQWYHVAFSFDNDTKEQALYLNGVRVASTISNRSIGYANNPVLLGEDINNGAFTFPLGGRIDEAAIFNRALSASEISAIYGAGANGKSTNHAPVVPNLAATTDLNKSLILSSNKLLRFATDAEGDALAIISARSTNGGTVSWSGEGITYTPAANFSGADRIDFFVSDSFVGVMGQVFVTVRPGSTAGLNVLGIVNNGGNMTISFVGIPNRYYVVQSTTNLALPVPPNWETLQTVRAGTNGLFNYTEPTAPGSRFYRSSGGTITAP